MTAPAPPATNSGTPTLDAAIAAVSMMLGVCGLCLLIMAVADRDTFLAAMSAAMFAAGSWVRT